jgi:pilus assembly protein CpaC
VGGRFTPEKSAHAKRWENALRAIYPLLDWDVEQLTPSGPMVFFRVYLLEVRKESLRSLGVRWPALVESAFVVEPQQPLAGALNFEASIQALESQGGLKILSHPEIAVRSPGEAELFSGGEIPLRTRTRLQSMIQWKSFGLLLKLKVIETQGAQVRAEIQTEVSQLDHAISLDETPGIRANRLKTQVDARLGAPLILCGMIQESTRKKTQGLPVLSSIPVLGALFGSKDYQEERSELLAVLIPHTQPKSVDPESIGEEFPRGPVPPPRNWISPSDYRRIRQSQDFPWNAL